MTTILAAAEAESKRKDAELRSAYAESQKWSEELQQAAVQAQLSVPNKSLSPKTQYLPPQKARHLQQANDDSGRVPEDEPSKRKITAKVLTRALILCNNEDKAAGRKISLVPRVQAEMLGHVRLHPMSPDDFVKLYRKHDAHAAVRRLCNVAMVINGAAGFSPSYVNARKANSKRSQKSKSSKIRMAIDDDWMPTKADSRLSGSDTTIISPQAVRMAVSYMSNSDAGRRQLCRPDGTSLEASLVTLSRSRSMSKMDFEREARKMLKPQVAQSLAKLAADISFSHQTPGGRNVQMLMDGRGSLLGGGGRSGCRQVDLRWR